MPYWRLSAVYFSYFAVVGSLSPYWALYLQSLGFSPAQIGILVAIPMLMKLGAPNLWGWVADVSGRRLTIIRLGALAAFCCFACIVFARDFVGFVCFTVAYGFFWSAIIAQFEVVTLAYLGENAQSYSRIRLWGSIGFIVAVMGLGWLLDSVDIGILPIVVGAFLFAIFMSAMSLPSQQPAQDLSASQSFGAILKQNFVLIFLLIYFLLQFSPFENLGPPFHLERGGLGPL